MHQEIIAVLIFVLVLVTIMSEKLHRTSAALGGTVLLLLTGILNVDKAIKYVDFNTIGVLVGMMLFVAVIKHSGLFEYISIKAVLVARRSLDIPNRCTGPFILFRAARTMNTFLGLPKEKGVLLQS